MVIVTCEFNNNNNNIINNDETKKSKLLSITFTNEHNVTRNETILDLAGNKTDRERELIYFRADSFSIMRTQKEKKKYSLICFLRMANQFWVKVWDLMYCTDRKDNHKAVYIGTDIENSHIYRVQNVSWDPGPIDWEI